MLAACSREVSLSSRVLVVVVVVQSLEAEELPVAPPVCLVVHPHLVVGERHPVVQEEAAREGVQEEALLLLEEEVEECTDLLLRRGQHHLLHELRSPRNRAVRACMNFRHNNPGISASRLAISSR